MQVLYSLLYPVGVIVVIVVEFVVGVVVKSSSSPTSTSNSFSACWLHASALLITRARHLAFCLFSCLKLTESANAA